MPLVLTLTNPAEIASLLDLKFIYNCPKKIPEKKDPKADGYF